MTGSTDSGHREASSVRGEADRASFVVDDEGVVVAWSPAAESLLGYPAHLVLGRAAKHLVIADAAADRETSGMVLRHRDGRHVACRVHVRAEHDAEAVLRWRIEVVPGEDETAAAVDRALVEALFTRSPLGLFVLDPQLRLTRYNTAAEGMQGIRVTEGLGLRPTEAWPDFGGELAEQVMSEVLRTGEPVLSFEKRGRPPGDPDREHVYSASVFRLQDDDGRILGVADVVVDVTEQHRARERLALAAEAGSRIGTTLDVLHTAGELADLVVPGLADSVAVDLLEPVLAGEDVPEGPGRAGWDLRRAASRSIRTDIAPGAYDVGEVSSYPATAPAAEVLTDHRPRLVPVVDADSAWMRGDEARARRMRQERVHSLMVVPLLVRDRALGLVALYRWTDRGAFGDDDLTLAQDLAGRAALALDNARRYVRERNAVLSLQRGLLPPNLPAAEAVQAARHRVHCGGGGDWTDVIALPGARVALVAGSTPGHGVRTAATMGRLRTAVQTLAALDLAPDEVMARLEDLVRQTDGEAAGPTAHSAVGATCLYLVYDPVSCRCTAATAGPAGLAMVGADGTVSYPDIPAGPPLGRPGPPFAKATAVVPEGSRLVLFTPGLLQAFTGDAGQRELERLLLAARESPQDLCLRLTEALVPTDPPNDAAVLVARTRPLDPARVATWVLPADPAAVATARSLTARQLSAWAMDDEMFSTELIVSELVTNAIRYAEPPVRLRLIRDRTLSVEVTDGSSAAPYLRHARTTDEGGRGLLLVSQFAQRWGTRYEDRGKTIWAEEPLSAAA
ncbi:SpoIIE family protein phosphatase [Streptomyces spinoverrucosus]|uniref:SpoIIE family protein phosphatase n=1 Tax=Streptomyces spinoverrucosus TaxID=284043 RepID=UPI0018C37868|nr:SpoIIE family protein phosphatase [Streptomyces spinoverrucosus]MBG0853722.1 SpoIIE family protein phosphatase [Streptomyces spinoverrucosus]